MRDETRSSAIPDARIIHADSHRYAFWVLRAFLCPARRPARPAIPTNRQRGGGALISRGSSANKMPVLSCLRPAADAPVAMEDEDEYPTARRARAFSRLGDAPAHDKHT